MKKAQECNKLIETINQGVKQIEAVSKDHNDDRQASSNLRKMSELYDQLALDTAKVDITTAELKAYSGQYQAMSRSVARSARDLAQAVDTKNAPQAKRAEEEFDKLVKDEDKLVSDMNKFCHQ